MPRRPSLLDAFERGARLTEDGELVAVRVVRAGEVRIASGRLAAGDPYSQSGGAFLREVRPGRHPVSLALARRAGGARPGLAQVRFAPGRPTRWELALQPGQDPGLLRPGQSFGFAVDSGTAALCDAEARALVDQRALERLSARLARAGGARASLVLDRRSGHNLVAFATGGDGLFAAYWGLGRAARPLCLVVDLGGFDLPRPRTDGDPAARAAEVARLTERLTAGTAEEQADALRGLRAYEEEAAPAFDVCLALVEGGVAADARPLLRAILRGRADLWRRVAARLVQATGNAAREALLEVLVHAPSLEDATVERVIEWVGARSPGVAGQAMRVLATRWYLIGAPAPRADVALLPAARAAVLARCDDPDPAVRTAVVRSLPDLYRAAPDPTAAARVADLLETRSRDPEPGVRRAALLAAANLVSRIPALAGIVDRCRSDADPETRALADDLTARLSSRRRP